MLIPLNLCLFGIEGKVEALWGSVFHKKYRK